jgi:hypothetical protein
MTQSHYTRSIYSAGPFSESATPSYAPAPVVVSHADPKLAVTGSFHYYQSNETDERNERMHIGRQRWRWRWRPQWGWGWVAGVYAQTDRFVMVLVLGSPRGVGVGTGEGR